MLDELGEVGVMRLVVVTIGLMVCNGSVEMAVERGGVLEGSGVAGIVTDVSDGKMVGASVVGGGAVGTV